MANINRDYLIVLDAKSSVISEADELKYYITDEHSQNLFVNLVVRDIERINKYVEVHDPEKYQLELHIVKPNNDIVRPHLQGNLLSAADAIYAFELPKEAVDYIGTYKCELRVTYKETEEKTITTSNKFKYKVKRSIYNDLDSIQDAPQYPVVIQLFDKLSDINQYEEDRRANELTRQLAEEQRQTRFNELDAAMVDSIGTMDNKVLEVENRITTKEQAVDKLIVDTKADIDNYKEAKDQEIDDYKTAKDTEINNAIANQDNKIADAITNQNDKITQAITAQDNKIDTAISNQNDRITVVENNVVAQNNRLEALENKATTHEARITATEAKNTEQDNRLDITENRLANIGNDITNTMQPIIDGHTSRLEAIEAIDVAQNNRLEAIEVKNQQQDDRLLDVEKVNNRQDIDIKCLYGASQTIDVTKEGNSIYLQNSNNGFTIVDEIKGNTLVNCNKEPDKELILNGNINASADNTVTITEGVDGGLVDIALEGNTLVNVSKTKDSTAITKAYTVENSGNHIALQGDIDGSCKLVITGNTLWIDNDTEEVLTTFDETKNLRLQSSFEDNLVTQEMVDSGEEVADNLGKYRVDYKSIQEDGTVGNTKTLYLNSPLLEGDTIEEKDNGIYHVHRSELVAYTEGDETSLITDKVNTLHGLVEPTYELIEQSNLVIPSYTNGHLDLTSAVPIEKVEFKPFSEELTYLYPSTSYTVQFVSDKAIAVDITLGGTQLLAQNIVAGLNRIAITTPATLVDNKLIISGVGANISEVVVTDTDREFKYFEGMKSVGECKDNVIEIICQNKNLIDINRFKVNDANKGTISIDGNVITFNYNGAWPTILHLFAQKEIDLLQGKSVKFCYGSLTDTVEGNKLSIRLVALVNGKYKYYTFLKAENYNNIITLPNNMQSLELSVVPNNTANNIQGIFTISEIQLMFADVENIDYISHQSSTQQLTHEPLRAVGDTKDRYVLIDGKWYIERNCEEYTITGNDTWVGTVSISGSNLYQRYIDTDVFYNMSREVDYLGAIITSTLPTVSNYSSILSGICGYPKSPLYTGQNWLYVTTSKTADELKAYFTDNPTTVVYKLATPQYEPIDYNPLEVYSDTTHITTNSTIPTNITIKNHGFNCLLKPSTTYTISSNLGLNTVTTPSTLTEDCLRFYDTDTSDVTTMKDVLILEGDWTTKADLIPANFSGIESAFEQEYDAGKGKYKVNIKVANEDKTRENNITFYINEPLRGVGATKDRIYIKDDKLVVQRNCSIRPYEDGDFGTYPTNKVNTVYPLVQPVYEEVEYNNTNLFIESFKNSTLFYNSNVPVTSTVHYSYSVPIVDTVAQTANVTDQQDSMIIDLATQVAVMEMMLM